MAPALSECAMRHHLLPFLLLSLPLQQGCAPLLYPVAQAFGSPSEGELSRRRLAFDRLKARKESARILIHPLVDPLGLTQVAPNTAELLVELLRAEGWASAAAARTPPRIPSKALGRNQLRYVQDRAEAYTLWAQSMPPDCDFFVVVEAFPVGEGRLGGVHCYVLEASGQVAYTRLFNSHHFGPEAAWNRNAACQMAVRALVRDLQRPALEVHPPYGIG